MPPMTSRPGTASPSSNGRGTDPAPPATVGAGDDETPARRLLRIAATTLVLALAAAIFAYGCSKGQSPDEAASNPVIVAQFPAPGGRALRQTDLGAELLVGYDGRLTINGIEIPEEQMEGAVDPSTLSEQELRQFGVRPSSRNRVVFRPGPGKVIESLDPGPVTIVLRYFKDRRESTTARTVIWTATVT